MRDAVLSIGQFPIPTIPPQPAAASRAHAPAPRQCCQRRVSAPAAQPCRPLRFLSPPPPQPPASACSTPQWRALSSIASCFTPPRAVGLRLLPQRPPPLQRLRRERRQTGSGRRLLPTRRTASGRMRRVATTPCPPCLTEAPAWHYPAAQLCALHWHRVNSSACVWAVLCGCDMRPSRHQLAGPACSCGCPASAIAAITRCCSPLRPLRQRAARSRSAARRPPRLGESAGPRRARPGDPFGRAEDRT